MKKKNRQKKTIELYNALIKLGCCGQCAFKKKAEIQYYLFCNNTVNKGEKCI